MKNNNDRLSGQGYRTTNGSKRLKVVVADSLSATRTRRTGQASRYNQIINNLSPEKQEYEDEDEPNDDIPDYDLTDSEPEQVEEEQMRAFKSVASTVRPLLQLFSEDSRTKPEKLEPVAPIRKKTARETTPQQIVYKDISLTSDEETEEALEESKNDDREVILNGETINPIHLETVPAKTTKRFFWTPKSTNVLLKLWEKHIKDFRGKRKNSLIYVEMAHEMKDFDVSHREIKSKIENMTKKQRTEAEKILNGDETCWPYYKRVKALIVGPIAADFEEIMFDNTESSEFFEPDHSNAGSELSDMKDLENVPNEVDEEEQPEEEEQEEVEVKKEYPPPVIRNTQKDEHRHKSKATTDERLLQIEIEKLQVEKQKLQVMKHISRDLSSISKTLVELLRNMQN